MTGWSKYPKPAENSCNLTDLWNTPEWGAADDSPPSFDANFFSPHNPNRLDFYRRPAPQTPICWEAARLGTESLFAEAKPLFHITHLRGSIVPLDLNPSAFYLFISGLSTATLMYGKRLGTFIKRLESGVEETRIRFELHQKFPNGSEFTGEVTCTEDGKNILFVSGTERFVDRHEGRTQTLTPEKGFSVRQQPGESGRFTLVFGTSGIFTLTESVKLSQDGFLIPDSNQRPQLKLSTDHKGKKYLLESSQTESIPVIEHTEVLSTNDPQRGFVQVALHFLSNGTLAKIVEIEHPQPGDATQFSLLLTPQTNAFERVAVRTLPLTPQSIPLGTVYAPDGIKLDATQPAVPFSQLAILYDSKGVASLVPASLSPGIWSGTKEIGNLRGILKPNGNVVLTPTSEQLGKLMTHPPKIGESTTIDLHGTIGNLTISPLAPLRIQGAFQMQNGQPVFIPEISQYTDDQRINVFVYGENGRALAVMLQVSIRHSGKGYTLETDYGSDPMQPHVYQTLSAPFQNQELVSIGSTAQLVNDRLTATKQELDQNPSGELIETFSNRLAFRIGRRLLIVNPPETVPSQELTQIILDSPGEASGLEIYRLTGTIVDPLTQKSDKVDLVLENGQWLIRNEQAGQRTVHELHYDSKAGRIQLRELLREEIALILPAAEPARIAEAEIAREPSSAELAGFDRETAELLQRPTTDAAELVSPPATERPTEAVCEAAPAIPETPAAPAETVLMTPMDAMATKPLPTTLSEVVEIPVVHFETPSAESPNATVQVTKISEDKKAMMITLNFVIDGKEVQLNVRRAVQLEGEKWSYQAYKASFADGSKPKKFENFPNKEGQGLRLVLPDGRQLILSSESIRTAEAGYRGSFEAVPALSCSIKAQVMIAAATTDLQALEAASLTEKAVADRKAAVEAAEAAKAAALAKQAESSKISVEMVQFPSGESFGGILELLNPGGKASNQGNYQYRLTWQDKTGEHSVEFTIFRRRYQLFPHNLATIDHIRFSKVDGGRFNTTPEGAILLYPPDQQGVYLAIPPEFLADLESERLREPSGLKRQITLISSEAEMKAVQRFCATETYLKRLEESDRKRAEYNDPFRQKEEALGLPTATIDAILSETALLTGGAPVTPELGDPIDIQSLLSPTHPLTQLPPEGPTLLESLSTLTMDRKEMTLPIAIQDGLTSRQFDGKLVRMASALSDRNTTAITYQLHLPKNQQITFTVNKTIEGGRTNYQLVIADIAGWAISRTGISLNFENLPMGGMEFKLPNQRVLYLDPGVLDRLEEGETSTNMGYVTIRTLPKLSPATTSAPTPAKARVEKTPAVPVCEAPPAGVAAIAATPATTEVATLAEPATDTAEVCVAEQDLPANPVMTFNSPLARDIPESTRTSRRTSIQLQMLKEEKDGKGNYRYSFRLTLDNGDRIDFQGSFEQTKGETPSSYFKLATSMYSPADGSTPTSIRGYVDLARGADDITVFPLPGNRTLRIHPHALGIAIDPKPYHQENIGKADNNYLSIIDPSLPKEVDAVITDPSASGVGVKVDNVEISKKREGYKITLHLSDGTSWTLTLSTDGTKANTKILSACTEIDGRRVFLLQGEGRKSEPTFTHPKTGLVASFYPWQLVRSFNRPAGEAPPDLAKGIRLSQAALPKTTLFELQAAIVSDLSEIGSSTDFETVHLEETGRELPYDPSSPRTYRLTLPATGEKLVITGKVIYTDGQHYYFRTSSCQLFQTPDASPIDITSRVRNHGGYAPRRYSIPLGIPVGERNLRILPGAFQIASGEERFTTNSTVIVIHKPPVAPVSGPTSTEEAPVSEDPRPAVIETEQELAVCRAPADPATPETTPPPLPSESVEAEKLAEPDHSKSVRTGVTYGEGSTEVIAHVDFEFRKEERFFENGKEYSRETFLLHLNETEKVELVFQRVVAKHGRLYTLLSAVAYSSDPTENGELRTHSHSNTFTISLKDGARIKLLPSLLTAAINSPGKPTSRPLVNILMPEENPATLICKEPPPVPPVKAEEPRPENRPAKPERARALTPLLYETKEGLIEARRRIAERFGINPELLYLPPDPEHSFPGMRIEPGNEESWKTENEEGTLHSTTYRKGEFALKVYFAPREVRGHMRSVPVRAEAAYGSSSSIPVEEVYPLEGRYHIALGGSFKGMVFYIDHFSSCRELSLHKLGEKIAELHDLQPISYRPRNTDYPINPTGTLLEAVDAQVEMNRALFISQNPAAPISVNPETFTCEPPADTFTTPPLPYSEETLQQIARAETTLRENIRNAMTSTELSRRSAKIDAAVALVKAHPYHPALQSWILAIQETYADNVGRQTSILWNFFNEFLSDSTKTSFNDPEPANAIEKMISRAIGKLEGKEEADRENLATLKNKAAEKEREAREKMRESIEEMMKEKR